MRLRVDPVTCDAFGYCAELLPERIWLDEWGYPVIDPGPLPPELVEAAEAAVRMCPRRALHLDPTPAPSDPRPRRLDLSGAADATGRGPTRRVRPRPRPTAAARAVRVALGGHRRGATRPSTSAG